jgi:outer membrane protein assembly factor BamB
MHGETMMDTVRNNIFWMAIVQLCIPLATASCNDWGDFRGPGRTGISQETDVPRTWSATSNIRWKARLTAPGNSSPVVAGDLVFVTCAHDDGKVRGLYCFDRKSGQSRWAKTVEYQAEDPTHPTNPYCGSSPAADRTSVVVWHGSAGVHCYDPAGELLWSRDLGKFRHIWGYGSSPIFYGESVILNCGPGPRQFVIALDRKTGKTLWQTDEPGGATGEEEENSPGGKPLWAGSWSTPVVAKVDGQDQILVSLPHQVKAYDPVTGKVLWFCEGLGDLVYTDPLVSNGIGVAMGGYHGPAMGFRLGGSGNVTSANRLWLQTSRNPQRIGSGLILGKHIFMANEIGLVQCLELETGKEIWKDRLPGAKIWGSLIAAEGRLYVTNQQGTTFMFAPNPDKFELLGQNEIGEPTNSTLAFSDGQAFLRTFEHLYCIESK